MYRESLNGVVFPHLEKAFDFVGHAILLTKVSDCGIRGKSLEWFQSYFFDRVRVCKVKQTLSNQRIIKRGVPQIQILAIFVIIIYKQSSKLPVFIHC